MKTFYIIPFVLSILFLNACKDVQEVTATSDIDRKVDSVLATMTLEEKVGQMTQITLDVFIKDGEKDARGEKIEPVVLNMDSLEFGIRKYKIGSILNTANKKARTLEFWNNSIDLFQKMAIEETGIPLIYGIDAIHGTSYTAESTLFPQQINQGATF